MDHLHEIVGAVLSGTRLGPYQRDLLLGRRRWSGADLKGRARLFALRYAESRRRVLALVQAEAASRGLRVELVDGTASRPLRLAVVGAL